MGTIAEVSIIKGARRNFNNDQLLHRIFEENIANGCGNKPALIFSSPSAGETKISYNMLNCAANKLASSLIDVVRHRELQPNNDGDYIVAVCMQPTDELITALLAVLKMGAAYLPIDPSFPANRVDHILTEAKPVCVIYDDAAVDRNLFGNNTLAMSFAECMTMSLDCNDANIPDDCMLTAGHLALVLYTSGSTGVPKGVRMPHSIILNRLRWQWERFPYSATETICIFKTALTFVDSLSEIWGPLLQSKLRLHSISLSEFIDFCFESTRTCHADCPETCDQRSDAIGHDSAKIRNRAAGVGADAVEVAADLFVDEKRLEFIASSKALGLLRRNSARIVGHRILRLFRWKWPRFVQFLRIDRDHGRCHLLRVRRKRATAAIYECADRETDIQHKHLHHGFDQESGEDWNIRWTLRCWREFSAWLCEWPGQGAIRR